MITRCGWFGNVENEAALAFGCPRAVFCWLVNGEEDKNAASISTQGREYGWFGWTSAV